MSNILERIKRTPFIAGVYRMMHPSFSACGCCGLPWAVAKNHTVDMVECTDEHCGSGFFTVCEWCWQHKPIEEIDDAIKKLYRYWVADGFVHDYEPPYTLGDMLKKAHEDYYSNQNKS